MNKIISQYILKELFGTWLGVTLVLLIVLITNKFADVISDIAAGDILSSSLIPIIALSSIEYLIILLPLSTFLSVIIVIGRFYRDHEMTAIQVAGKGTGFIYRAFLFPLMWCLKYRLYPPIAALLVSYAITLFTNVILFVITYIVLSRFVYVSQNNIMRSFTLFESKNHYMTIAAVNENDVSAIVKKIDPHNKIRFERHAVKAPKVVHKVILKENKAAD